MFKEREGSRVGFSGLKNPLVVKEFLTTKGFYSEPIRYLYSFRKISLKDLII